MKYNRKWLIDGIYILIFIGWALYILRFDDMKMSIDLILGILIGMVLNLYSLEKKLNRILEQQEK